MIVTRIRQIKVVFGKPSYLHFWFVEQRCKIHVPVVLQNKRPTLKLGKSYHQTEADTSKGAIVMLDILGKVEFVHHNRDDGDHSGIDSGHMPSGIATFACPGHNMVGGGQAQCLNLKMVSHGGMDLSSHLIWGGSRGEEVLHGVECPHPCLGHWQLQDVGRVR